jgi:cellulose synthase (UDP-forming)
VQGRDNHRKIDSLIRVDPPAKKDIYFIRILIVCGVILMWLFCRWFFETGHIGHLPIYFLLTCALLFKLLKMVHEWYHYWSPSIPVPPPVTKKWTVDMFTTACPGEPHDMIIGTLTAMKNVRYPHTTYLCDEGNDPLLKKFCEENDIIHVTRVVKVDAKAGNINNALRQAKGEICVVLDPDHVPVPEFIDQVLPYFEDPGVGFVQCVQGYKNQSESLIARGAAEQTYHFYGPMMMCMNTYGTAQAIGANCTFRRTALDSIGGHAAGLSEDMHTAMQLHAKGWKSVYIPEILTRGLVPATLSSFYKQQLKWSRGTFELLFRTYPGLFRNFTWRQKIHYLTIPFYFLFGLINLVDFCVPLLALGMARTPWEMDLREFSAYFLPLCTVSLCIRLSAQKWLLEPHERGLHFAGGIVRLATWWVFLVGFVYSIFNIRVPYIPTPKGDEHRDNLRLSFPNIIVIAISVVIVGYGLSIDWSPYSIAMACYSMLTSGMLLAVVLLSQQRSAAIIAMKVARYRVTRTIVAYARTAVYFCSNSGYRLLNNIPAITILCISYFFLSYQTPQENDLVPVNGIAKETGNFYFGYEGSEPGFIRSKRSGSIRIVPVAGNWLDTVSSFPLYQLNRIRNDGDIPFVTMDADTNARSVGNGGYAEYLKRSAQVFREFGEPVFITFKSSGDTPGERYRLTWQYLHTYFTSLGISNLTWVWCPQNPQEEDRYPGEKFVDWIGVECLNYAEHMSKSDWYTFGDIYGKYRRSYGHLQKPVLLTALGCASGPGQDEWFSDAFAKMKSDFHEIGGAIVYTGVRVTGSDQRISFDCIRPIHDVTDILNDDRFAGRKPRGNMLMLPPDPSYKSKFIRGTPGHYTLASATGPSYVRGVAYNTAHDWRDGFMPLTRRQLEKDFRNIRLMGANVIRRYNNGIYDRNVLNIADEFGLKVQFGFWFDPKVDYFADSAAVREYISNVEETVLKYRDHPAVFAWCIGNETWGLLKHNYARPYLVQVRNAYVRMIEHLAQRIHRIDPSHPVISSIEHETIQLGGELAAFRDKAPSLDIIGINSYYRQQISQLNHVAWQFDSLRPYMVSEFGPSGYWDPRYNAGGSVAAIEESDEQKGEWYSFQWKYYVKAYRGFNVGGYAFCWHDRMEGSYTWFGLTDYKGRLKPSYYALRRLWTGNGSVDLPEVGIQMQASSAGEDGQLRFGAVLGTSDSARFHYEWKLLRDEYLGEVDGVKTEGSPLTVRVKKPSEPSDYRLYLFVSDNNDENVTCCSYPIKVR